MTRLLTLLVCLPAFCTAQATATKRVAYGPIEFTADASGIEVLYHGHEWIPDLSKLPIRANDCQDTAAREECRTHPGTGCLQCLSDWQPVAWDELNEILYLAVSAGPSNQRTRTVLGYDLRSERINRVVDGYEGSYAGTGAVSPSGRYLALVGAGVCGACCASADLVLIDTQAGSVGSIHVPGAAGGETVRITAVRWSGPAVVEYSADIQRESDCRTGGVQPLRKITGSAGVPGLLKPPVR